MTVGKTPVTKPVPSARRSENAENDEFMAAAIGDVDWLKLCLKTSKQTNFDSNGLAAVHLAALHGRLECLKLLIERYKHDVNLRSSTGWTPIHLAISNQTGNRSFVVLEYLLTKGADFSVTNDDGVTPMHQAASEGHIQCLKALIAKGAKLNVKDYRGHTPLDLAKLWGHRQCARILATEQWHQDKDDVAKEISRLRKAKLIDDLNSLSLLDPQQEDKQWHGIDAYKVWLHDNGMHADETGLIGSRKKDSTPAPAKRVAVTSGLYQPNSIAVAEGIKKPMQEIAISKERTMDSFPDSTMYYSIHEKPEKITVTNPKPRKDTSSFRRFFVKEEWNFSPQCKMLGHYQKNLPDCYPRNPITKLPDKDATPKYLATHKNVPVSAFSKPDSYKSERRVVFQPETILDAQTKFKYSEEQLLNKPQVFMHLINDINSQMFQRSLYADTTRVERSPPSKSVTPDRQSSIKTDLFTSPSTQRPESLCD